MAVVEAYAPPRGVFGWTIMAFSASTMLLFSRRSHFTPSHDSVLYPLASSSPAVFETAAAIQPWVFGIAVGIHFVEAMTFHHLKLRKYRVPAFSLVWWQWILSVFIEGLPAFARIDEVAKEKEVKKRA